MYIVHKIYLNIAPLISYCMRLFQSFFIGGYECADIINNRGNRVDLLQDTFHDVRVTEDYALLAAAGITTVREGMRWSVVEKQPHQYDFSEVRQRIAAAQQHGMSGDTVLEHEFQRLPA